MAPSKMSNFERIQKLLDIIRDLDNSNMGDFVTPFQPYINLVSAEEYDTSHYHHPSVVFSYIVQPEHCNRMNNMHGGATATLFDFCTSLASALVPRSPGSGDGSDNDEGDEEDDVVQSWRKLGVSRTLAITYVRPAPSGVEVLVECEQVHGGKRTASLRGIMRRRSDGAVLATCEHGKVIPDVKL